MDQTLAIVEQDLKLKDVWKVGVPGIYGKKGDPLPARMARLVLPAAQSLQQVYRQVVAEGGRLFISDMFRSAADQLRATKTGSRAARAPTARRRARACTRPGARSTSTPSTPSSVTSA